MRHTIKSGVRVIGIDDSPFTHLNRRNVTVVGAIYKGGCIFDGLLTTTIRRDGWNATDKILAMLETSKFIDQLHYIILDGIALGGFNIVDINKIFRQTNIKTLVAMRRKPSIGSIKKALTFVSQPAKRFALIEKAGPIFKVQKLYCQLAGLNKDEAVALAKLTCTHSHLPEPLRAAHLIGGGIVLGQSGKRA